MVYGIIRPKLCNYVGISRSRHSTNIMKNRTPEGCSRRPQVFCVVFFYLTTMSVPREPQHEVTWDPFNK